MKKDSTKRLSKLIRIDESEIRNHLYKVVVGTVEETINALLDAEADEMCHVSATNWGTLKYMNMKLLNEMDKQLKYSVA